MTSISTRFMHNFIKFLSKISKGKCLLVRLLGNARYMECQQGC